MPTTRDARSMCGSAGSPRPKNRSRTSAARSGGSRIAVAESAFDVIDTTSTAEERTQAVLDTKQAAERIGRLKAEITELEKERARYQAELDAYRQTVVLR